MVMDEDNVELVEQGRFSYVVGVAAARSSKRILRGPVSPEEVSGVFWGGLFSSECGFLIMRQQHVSVFQKGSGG